MKQFLKSLIPPIILQILNFTTRRSIQWSGDYKSFDEAQAQSKGYDPDIYLSKLIDAVKIVKDDESKCERDSILFDKIIYPYPLLSNLFSLSTYFQAKSLYILDFGGSMGSIYFQNRKFLHTLPHFTWNILEQDKIIQAGKKYFQTQELLFHSSFSEAANHIKPLDTKILILSSVMQYVKTPYKILQSLIDRFNFDAIIVDRTPFNINSSHRITIQKVPQKIYQTQYPCHLFSKEEFISFFTHNHYSLFDEFISYCDTPPPLPIFTG
ncbi:methyltransferase, TIGR04325 family [Helicobacter cholecystus]|uniref:methyltransferase, TIGR04325 family n=1 Tax=Helicobacter cholecystus TaxID=45498 RepID=UPI00273A1636|nr:methyltransferase, TIGR04325 family [Helicobacter cholecystus]